MSLRNEMSKEKKMIEPEPRIIQETITKVISKEIKYLNPEWLRFKRKEKGYSYRHLAKLVGVSASFLSDIEKGHRRMTNPVLVNHCVTILMIGRMTTCRGGNHDR